MPRIIHAYENNNQPILPGNNGLVPLTYFNLIKLSKDEEFAYVLPRFETVAVVLSGTVDIEVAGMQFKHIGQRKDIWSGNADSVYAPSGKEVTIRCRTIGAEIAVAGGRFNVTKESIWSPFRISPDEVLMVDVGSTDTHSHRRIYHILGKNTEGRSGNLLVSELYADPGCWSGYPPHKHDEDQGESETRFEEVYHYRFDPENGFGIQLVFQADGKEKLFRTRNRDTVIIDKGYHPTVTSPGHKQYIFTILVGATTRSLVQNFKEEYRYLMNQIPGIQNMVDHFK